MKINYLCGFAVTAVLTISAAAIAQSANAGTVTLKSPFKYKHDVSRALFDFELQQVAKPGERWDIGYGSTYSQADHDWLMTSLASRSVIRDLGKHTWLDQLTVRAIDPLPVLQPGERRVVTINTSGVAAKTPGPSVTSGTAGDPGIGDSFDRTRRFEGTASTRPMRDSSERIVPTPGPVSRPMEPRVITKGFNPFIEAIPGHLYEMHVVDNQRDFYVLFRVETVTRGDNCTLSWKVIPAPVTK
jgi:hypothetical protein